MATNDHKSHASCPYWSAKTMKCKICSGGLFIPLNDHIETYCKTPSHEQCLQYSMHLESDDQCIDKTADRYKNRRKYTRVATQRNVTLVQLINSKRIVTHHPIAASTIDMSMGGMRIHTDRPLTSDSLMHLSFEPPLGDNQNNCIGQVAWCNKQIDEPGYQVGISFHDEQFIQTMGIFLGNQSAHR